MMHIPRAYCWEPTRRIKALGGAMQPPPSLYALQL